MVLILLIVLFIIYMLWKIYIFYKEVLEDEKDYGVPPRDKIGEY